MNLFLCQVIIFSIFTFCEPSDNLKKVKISSRAISNLVNNLRREEPSVKFKIAVIGENRTVDELVGKICSELTETVEVYKYPDDGNYTAYLTQPQLVLHNGKQNFRIENIENISTGFNRYPSFKRTFIIAFNIFSSGFPFPDDLNITNRNSPFKHHSYFQLFYTENNSISLFNNILYPNGSCNPTFNRVNSFSQQTMEWESPNFIQKYDDYLNCNVKVIYTKLDPPIDYFLSHEINKKGNKILTGYLGELANIFASKHNIKYNLDFEMSDRNFDIFIDTFYDFVDLSLLNGHMTTPVLFSRTTVVVTRGAPYSFFERLILPFDCATWICLIITFSVALCTIFVVYWLSEDIQKFVFGTNIRNPTLNFFQIFFAIGLVRVPGRNFARFIFIMFTLFCLIIRTAYQGKMFEFITTDVSKHTAETKLEWINMKIPIYQHNFQDATNNKTGLMKGSLDRFRELWKSRFNIG